MSPSSIRELYPFSVHFFVVVPERCLKRRGDFLESFGRVNLALKVVHHGQSTSGTWTCSVIKVSGHVRHKTRHGISNSSVSIHPTPTLLQQLLMALVQGDIPVCRSIQHRTCAALPLQRIARVGQVYLRAVEVSNACCSGKESISVYVSALFIMLATWSVLASVV